jgi:signal transduction histidine kinase
MTSKPLQQVPPVAASILNHLPQPALACSADGVLLHANPALLKSLGLNLGACLTAGFGGLFDPHSRAQTMELLRLRLLTDQEFTLDCQLLVPPVVLGQPSLFRLRAWREGGTGAGAVWLMLAEDLHAEHPPSAAASANFALNQFSAVAAHDLQEPLRMINGFLMLLKRKHSADIPAQGLEYLAFAIDGADRMQVLLKRMFTYAHVAGNHPQPTRTDAEQVLHEVLATLQPQIVHSSAEITSLPLPLPVILADREQLGMLLTQLLQNALTFQPAGRRPVVQLSITRRLELGWVISVHDNGIGIAAADQDRIFAPFQRLHARTEYPGTGLGLAICEAIVRGHGGRMWVESAGANSGATFFAALPVGPDTES